MFLSRLDYWIIGVSFGAMFLLGVAASRLARKSLANYFLGGRNLPWGLLGVTGMSGWLDLTGTMIITSFLYLMGPRGLYIEFRGGAVLSLSFLLAFANKWVRRSGCMTLAEWNTYRFGTDASAEGIRFITAMLGIIMNVTSLSFLVRGATLFMGMIFPVDPVMLSMGVILFASIYTVIAGFYGVVLTDLLQGTIYIFGSIIISVIAWHHVPSGAALAAAARTATGNAQWAALLPAWHVTVPKGYEAYHDLVMASLFYLARSLVGGFGSSSSLALAARNPREASMLCVIQGATIMFRWPLMISFAIMGILLVSRVLPDRAVVAGAAEAIHEAEPQLGDNNWPAYTSRISHHPETAPPVLVERLSTILGPRWATLLPIVSFRGTVNPELILPVVVLNDLTPGFRGLIIVALLSALMGALATSLNGTSALFVRDIYQNFVRKRAGNGELITAAYVSSGVFVTISFILGLRATSMNEIWVWYVMGLSAGSLGPSLLRLYWWRANAWGLSCGISCGIAAAISQRALWPAMPEPVQLVTMAAISFTATIVGSLLTPPTPELIVRRFYETTKPMGFWRKYKSALPPLEQAAISREHRNDLATLVCSLASQICLFMLPMQFMVRNWRGFFGLLPVFLSGCAGLYFFWWKNLPSLDEKVPDFVDKAPVHTLEELQSAE